MKITALSAQIRNPDRVNVSIDGKYRFSLDISQVIDLGVKVGRDITEQDLADLEQESQFGKLYSRTLEWLLLRPHSSREVRDYLYKKTLSTKFMPKPTRGKRSAEQRIIEKPGYAIDITERVFLRLQAKGYINDETFARWWVENRNAKKGSSLRKLGVELRTKGVESTIINSVLQESDRNDQSELAKLIQKKRNKYPDDQKLMAYLARQGFSFDDIKTALQNQNDEYIA